MYVIGPDECVLGVRWIGKSPQVIALPCYPEEAQETVQASWQSTPVIGRTGHIHAFTGTNPITSSFSFMLHREFPMASHVKGVQPDKYIDRIIDVIKSACYPIYDGGLKPPRTVWKFGDMWISGILNSATFTWGLPIVNRKYSVCTVNISMTSVHSRIISADDFLGGKVRTRVSFIEGDGLDNDNEKTTPPDRWER